jgi:hypothetical protein
MLYATSVKILVVQILNFCPKASPTRPGELPERIFRGVSFIYFLADLLSNATEKFFPKFSYLLREESR